MQRLRAFLPDVADTLGLVGATALCYGIAQIHRPSAWIAAGVLSLTAAVLIARRES